MILIFDNQITKFLKIYNATMRSNHILLFSQQNDSTMETFPADVKRGTLDQFPTGGDGAQVDHRPYV